MPALLAAYGGASDDSPEVGWDYRTAWPGQLKAPRVVIEATIESGTEVLVRENRCQQNRFT